MPIPTRAALQSLVDGNTAEQQADIEAQLTTWLERNAVELLSGKTV